jgi:hypothetical protein
MITVLPPARPSTPVFGVAEGAAGHGQSVDPSLQLGGDRKVVHRRADHHDVGGQEGVESGQTVGDIVRERRLFGYAPWPAARWAPERWSEGLGDQVAVADLKAPALDPLRGDDRGRQRAAHRAGAQDAGIDVKQFHDLGTPKRPDWRDGRSRPSSVQSSSLYD